MDDSQWFAGFLKWAGLAVVGAIGGLVSYLAYLRKTKNPFVWSELSIDSIVGAFSGVIGALLMSETSSSWPLIVAVCAATGTLRTAGIFFLQSVLAKRAGVSLPENQLNSKTKERRND